MAIRQRPGDRTSQQGTNSTANKMVGQLGASIRNSAEYLVPADAGEDRSIALLPDGFVERPFDRQRIVVASGSLVDSGFGRQIEGPEGRRDLEMDSNLSALLLGNGEVSLFI